MDDHAVLTDVVGDRFAGLDRFAARKAVKEALDELGLLLGVDAHEHAVGQCSRCGTVVEPRLSDQWFVAVRPLADKAAQAIRDGRTVFVPESRAKPFLEWLDNLHDWCISRQIWWGHRIPAWYGPDGQIRVSREDIDEAGWVQTRTSSTPGSARSCGRSACWGGRARGARPPSSRPGSRRRRWSPGTTSTPSGCPGC
jgi:valyl-tRNA synthetase